MRKFFVLVLAFAALAGNVFAQGAATDSGITANGVIGEVAAVDVGNKTLIVKTDAGSVVIVSVADTTSYKRLKPGEAMANAVDMKLAEIVTGDRVFARGKVSDDRRSATARMLIVNTKADLAAKGERERAEWKARGVVGVVSAVNPETKEITLQTRGAGAPQAVVIPAGAANVKFRRYAPDSIKFSEAKASTFEEIKVNDQLRALGTKSEDGARFTPEEVVTGSFRTLVGTITAVDAATNEIQIKTMQGGQPLTVVVRPDSMLRRVPDEFAAMMQGRMAAMAAGGGGQPGGGGGAVVVRQPREGAPPAAGGGAPGQGGGGGGPQRRVMGGPGGMNPAEMLESMPAAMLAELKPGQMIVFSTTGADPARVTAIQLVAGIEPIVAMMQARGAGGAGRMPGGGMGGGGDAGMGFGFGIGQP